MTLYWDFDGTLVSSPSLWSTSVLETLKTVEPDTTVTLSDIRLHMAHGFPWHTPEQDNGLLVGNSWWEYMNAHFYRSYLALGIGPSQAKTASSIVREILLQPENYTLYPDCHTVLQESVNQGCQNILLSNNHPDMVPLMHQLDLAKYFDHFIISGEVGYNKPRKEIFALAKRISQGSTHVMIGDSLSADIRGGKAAGMTTVLVHKPPSPEADFSLASLSELFPALLTLEPARRAELPLGEAGAEGD